MTADLLDLFNKAGNDVVTFPILLVRRGTGRELMRLPGISEHEDIALAMLFAQAGPVDAVDVRDPNLVVWGSDWPDAQLTRDEKLARRLAKARGLR